MRIRKIWMLAMVSLVVALESPYSVHQNVAASESKTQSTKYEAGMYKVGVDMAAGEYIIFSEEKQTGYFCLSEDSNQENIIQNANFDYNSIITVKEGEYLELNRSYAISSKENPDIDVTGSGMFEVGKHIQAGEYRLIADKGIKGYYCVYDSSRQEKIVSNGNFENSRYVTVSDGQFIELDRCYIEKIVEYSKSEEKNKEGKKIEPLTKDDFTYNNAYLKKYGYNVLECLNYECPEGGCYKIFDAIGITFRDLIIGISSKEQLLEKYGIVVSYPYEVDMCGLSSRFEVDSSVDERLKNNCDEIYIYNYEDQAQIIFYVGKERVNYALFANDIYFEADKETIKYVQESLNALGYDCGTPDGIAGQKTKDAIMEFQRENGLFESGLVDDTVLKALANIDKSEQAVGISVEKFVERYNEAIEYYNEIATRDNYNKAKKITVEMVTESENFSPDGELDLCVNPNTTNKEIVGIINIFAENMAGLDANVATGEVMAMLYAFDLSLADGAAALELWTELNEDSEISKNGITYNNYSFGGMVVVKGEYEGFEITK